MFHSALCPRGETAQCPVCVIMAFKHVMKLVVWIPNSGLSFFPTLLEHSVIHVCSLPFYETPHNDDNRLCGSARTRTLCVAAIKLQIKETSHFFFFFFKREYQDILAGQCAAHTSHETENQQGHTEPTDHCFMWASEPLCASSILPRCVAMVTHLSP